MTLGYVAGPTGGIAYHSAAFRYRSFLWQPFVAHVGVWLRDAWAPQAKSLVIFGSSAGWTLDERFLSGFIDVVCIEPDPLARFLFKRRFAGLKGLRQIGRDDILPSRLKEVLDRDHPNAAVLFSNVLGQLPLQKKQTALDPELFAQTMQGREWASYHDLFSARAPMKRDFPRELKQSDAEAGAGSIAARFFAPPAEVIDHETLWLSKDRATLCADWELRPGLHHAIAFVHG